MWSGRVILHADADAFFASVAQREDPSLRDRAVIVGSWVVMAATWEAKRRGVRSGMRTAAALALCPEAVVVRSEWAAIQAASRALFAVFERTAEVVEPGSLEEAFLDVTGRGAPAELGARLRRELREEVGLPVSVGVARTKVLAKLAGRAAKPDGLRVVAPAQERAFLDALAVEAVPGVGPATARRLRAAGLATVGAVAARGEPELIALLGKAAGRLVHAVAHGRDLRPVQPRRPPRSIGSQRALGARSLRDAEPVLDELAARVAGRMASAGRAGRTVTLRLRFADRSLWARSRTLPYPTVAPEAIAAAARDLLPRSERRSVTLVGIAVANLGAAGSAGQLELTLGP